MTSTAFARRKRLAAGLALTLAWAGAAAAGGGNASLPVLVAAGVPATPSAASSDAPAAPAPAARVPIALVRGKTVVPVRVGGQCDLRLILDSGMGFDGLLLFEPSLRDSLGVANVALAKIPGAGGGPPSDALVAEGVSFRVGEERFDDQRVIILAADRMSSPEIDGVIGYSLLGHYAVAIDFDALALVLHDPAAFAPGPGWTSLPLRLGRNNLPFLDVAVAVADGDPVPMTAYIDCASSETVELLVRPAAKFTVPTDATEAVLGRGLSGDVHGKRAAISRLVLGPYALDGVLAAFTPAEIRSKAGEADAVLANGALRRFNLVFDYARSRLLLLPNEHFHDPYEAPFPR